MLSLGVGLQTLASDRLTKSGLFDAIFVSSRRDFRGPGGDGPRKPPADSTKDKPKENPKPSTKPPANNSPLSPTSPMSTRKSASSPTSASTTIITPPTSLASPNPHALPAPSTASSANIFPLPPPKSHPPAGFRQRSLRPAASLVGKEITLRYAERRTLSSDEIAKEKDIDAQLDAMMSGGISIVTREKKLRVVGVIESDPSAGIGGFGGGRVFLPIRVAEQLHAAQANDVQDFVRGGGSGKPPTPHSPSA